MRRPRQRRARRRRTSFTRRTCICSPGSRRRTSSRPAQREFAASIRSFRALSREEAARHPSESRGRLHRAQRRHLAVDRAAHRRRDGEAVDAGDHERLRADAAAAPGDRIKIVVTGVTEHGVCIMRVCAESAGPSSALLAVGFACVAYIYLTLPDVRVPAHVESRDHRVHGAARARGARAEGEQPRRVQQWVSYARISPHLIRAVLVAEDSAFWTHEGVDYEQIKESMEVNIERMEFARGASTITQQLAKNLYLSPSKNPIRKLRELLIARRLEAELLEAAHPRAVSERDRVGRRHLRRGSGGADLLSEVRRGARPPGVGAARRRRSSIRALLESRASDARGCAGVSRWCMRRMGAVAPPPVVAEPGPCPQAASGAAGSPRASTARRGRGAARPSRRSRSRQPKGPGGKPPGGRPEP